MGEAKRKKLAAASLPPAPPKLGDRELHILGESMSRVLGAITNFHGADCLVYAGVGARVLKELGYSARMVVGSAAWRVGPGDGDVISHAMEINQPETEVFAPDVPVDGKRMAGMFHAWLEVGEDIVDFTTGGLADKARQLDAADGGKTDVRWAPEVLWVPRSKASDLRHVLNAFDEGVFGYRRHEKMEQFVLRESVRDFDFSTPASAVLMAYRMHMETGVAVNVIGFGGGEEQTLESAREAVSYRKIMRP